jgi:hypothetical protein
MEDNAIYTESNESIEAAIEEDIESEMLRGFLYAEIFFFSKMGLKK